jgi:geranyl diphosphate synthase
MVGTVQAIEIDESLTPDNFQPPAQPIYAAAPPPPVMEVRRAKGEKRLAFSTAALAATGSWLGRATGSVFAGSAIAGLASAVVAYYLARKRARRQKMASEIVPHAVGPAANDLGVHLMPTYELYPTVPKDLEDLRPPISTMPVLSYDQAPDGPDPFSLVRSDVAPLSEGMGDLVRAKHPVLQMAATQLLSKKQSGKAVRPTMVTLMSYTCAGGLSSSHRSSGRFALQRQLAQITEMIHVASLIHDDVLDEADTRRGEAAVHNVYGNKVAVLAGDYLLATASTLLAELQDTRVVNVMATALKSLVQGEVMQLQMPPAKLLDMDTYVRKSYHKTASLITLSLRSTAILGGFGPDSPEVAAAGEYGYHMGLAFQIVDDILDFTANADELGKPACADMSLGLATAPVLFALEHDKSLKPRILRRFSDEGDVETTFAAVHANDGAALKKSRDLALWHAQKAVNAIQVFPPSEARDALVRLAHVVITRRK